MSQVRRHFNYIKISPIQAGSVLRAGSAPNSLEQGVDPGPPSLVRKISSGCTLAGGPALEGLGFTRLLPPPLPLPPVWPPRVPPRPPRAPPVLLLPPRPRPLPKLLSRGGWDSRLGPATGPAGRKCLSTRRCHLILACMD
jgi:hypothetical protein